MKKKNPCHTCTHNLKASKARIKELERKIEDQETTVRSYMSKNLDLIEKNHRISERHIELFSAAQNLELRLELLRSTGRETFIPEAIPPLQQNQRFYPQGPFIPRGSAGPGRHH